MVFPVGPVGYFFQFPADILRLAGKQGRAFGDGRGRLRLGHRGKGLGNRFRFHFRLRFRFLQVVRDGVLQKIRIQDPGQVAFYFLKVLLDFV